MSSLDVLKNTTKFFFPRFYKLLAQKNVNCLAKINRKRNWNQQKSEWLESLGILRWWKCHLLFNERKGSRKLNFNFCWNRLPSHFHCLKFPHYLVDFYRIMFPIFFIVIPNKSEPVFCDSPPLTRWDFSMTTFHGIFKYQGVSTEVVCLHVLVAQTTDNILAMQHVEKRLHEFQSQLWQLTLSEIVSFKTSASSLTVFFLLKLRGNRVKFPQKKFRKLARKKTFHVNSTVTNPNTLKLAALRDLSYEISPIKRKIWCDIFLLASKGLACISPFFPLQCCPQKWVCVCLCLRSYHQSKVNIFSWSPPTERMQPFFEWSITLELEISNNKTRENKKSHLAWIETKLVRRVKKSRKEVRFL